MENANRPPKAEAPSHQYTDALRTIMPLSGDVFIAQRHETPPCIPAQETEGPIAIQETIIAEINDALAALEDDADNAESIEEARLRHPQRHEPAEPCT